MIIGMDLVGSGGKLLLSCWAIARPDAIMYTVEDVSACTCALYSCRIMVVQRILDIQVSVVVAVVESVVWFHCVQCEKLSTIS